MKLNISVKTIIMIVAFALALAAVSLVICGRILSDTIDKEYRDKTTALAETVARVVDVKKFETVKNEVMRVFNATENKVRSDDWGSDEFYEYIARYSYIEEMEEFVEIRDYLRKIQEVNDVDCLYLSWVDAKEKAVIYIIDAALEDACPPGCFDELYEMNYAVITDPAYGFPAYITDTEKYGWLVSAGAPIYDSHGVVIGYSFVDTSMEEVRNVQNAQILQLVIALAGMTAIICILGIVIVNFTLVKPLKVLSKSAAEYCKNDDTSAVHTGFANLNINNRDEIGALCDSMKQLERDLNDHISKLLAANTELTISRHIADHMTELANKDSLTGVRNKTSYDAEIIRLEDSLRKGNVKFGIAMVDLNYLKRMNDNNGHDFGDKYLIRLSHLICEVFDHSPVFRIGGDEFAVILENRDYEGIEELVKTFNIIVDRLSNDMTLEVWERVSAALGYALFDPTIDSSVNDVFKRADKAMYDRKREMKGGRE